MDDTEKYLAAIGKREKEIYDSIKNDTDEKVRLAVGQLKAWRNDVVQFQHKVGNLLRKVQNLVRFELDKLCVTCK